MKGGTEGVCVEEGERGGSGGGLPERIYVLSIIILI
jgi:hypothetical protein